MPSASRRAVSRSIGIGRLPEPATPTTASGLVGSLALRLRSAFGLESLQIHVLVAHVLERSPRSRGAPRRSAGASTARRDGRSGGPAAVTGAPSGASPRAPSSASRSGSGTPSAPRTGRRPRSPRPGGRAPSPRPASITRSHRSRMPGLVDLGRRLVPVLAGQTLPFDRQRAVALEVPERPVVAEHVEAVAGAFPRPPRLVAPVRPIADARAQQLLALVRRHLARRGAGAGRREDPCSRTATAAATFVSPSGSKSTSVTSSRGSGSRRRRASPRAPRRLRVSRASSAPTRPLGPRRPRA